jgi:hypothetical protein
MRLAATRLLFRLPLGSTAASNSFAEKEGPPKGKNRPFRPGFIAIFKLSVYE